VISVAGHTHSTFCKSTYYAPASKIIRIVKINKKHKNIHGALDRITQKG
jgi:hypothetical protein